MIAILTAILAALGLVAFYSSGTSTLWKRLLFSALFLLAYTYSIVFFALDSMTGQGLDESVFYHMKHGIAGAGMGQFRGLILKALVLVIIGLALAFSAFRYPSRWMITDSSSKHKQRLALCAFLISFLANPLSLAVYQHAQSNLVDSRVSREEHSAFQQVYRDPKQIPNLKPFNPHKNFIYIFMESLERTYFDQNKFPGVMPRLRKWEDRAVSFTNISDSPGTGFTMGGIVASLCGIPLVTSGGTGNSMNGVENFLPGATCVSDLLKDAGYHQTYVGGADLAFAGKGNFLKSHGFDTILGKNEIFAHNPNVTLEGWGAYDDTLLDIVFDHYKELVTAKKPFGLYTLTLDAHDVHPSPRCIEDGVLVGDGGYLDSVRCTDYLLDQFINRVLETEHGNNTLIVVSSDHYSMNFHKEGAVKIDYGKRRNSLFVLGSNSSESYDTAGTKMDIAATILSFMGYPGEEFGLGRDLLTGETLASQDSKFASSIQGMTGSVRQFWEMPNIRKSPTVEVDVMAKQLRLGFSVYRIPILLSVNSLGDIVLIVQDNIDDKHPPAHTEHSGSTIAVDHCDNFQSKSKLEEDSQNFCLFVKDQSSASGQLCLLQLRRGFVAVDLNVPRRGIDRSRLTRATGNDNKDNALRQTPICLTQRSTTSKSS